MQGGKADRVHVIGFTSATAVEVHAGPKHCRASTVNAGTAKRKPEKQLNNSPETALRSDPTQRALPPEPTPAPSTPRGSETNP